MVDHIEMRNAYLRASLPPDSGNWHKIKGQFIESLDDDHFKNDVFQVKKHGLYDITVDGFPRQGNRYIRRKILLSLPSAAMPYPLVHKQSVLEKAIEEQHFVFSTFRDPIDSISSYISEFIKIDTPHRILNILKDKIYTTEDYDYVEKCFLFYIRMTDFIVSNIKDIYVIPFSSVINDNDNSLSFKISQIINDSNYVSSGHVEPHSSADSRMKDYLNSDKFTSLSEQAYSSYNSVMTLAQMHPNRFV